MARSGPAAKGLSSLTLAVLGFFLGVCLYPIIFHVPHGAKITKVISNFAMGNNANIQSTSGQFLFENHDTLEPSLITGATEIQQTKGTRSGSRNSGRVAYSAISLGNLQYVLNSSLYAKFSEYSSVYASKEAETYYSIDKILGPGSQYSFLPMRLERLDIEGRVKSMTQGSFAKKNNGRVYIALLTDALEVVLLDRVSNDIVWKVDFKNYLDTSRIHNIDEYVVSIQVLPDDEKNTSSSMGNDSQQTAADRSAPQGPPTQDGIYPGGKEKKGIVFAVWRLKLVPDMFGSISILLFVALDGKTGNIKWASIAQTLDESNVDAFKKINPEPVYFNLADTKTDEEKASTANNDTNKSTTRKYDSKDSERVDIVGILSHMAACRLPVSSNSSSVEGYTNSMILGVNAEKYTTKKINKRSNTNAANKKKNKSTFREIVEASNSGNTELSYKSDTLLFVSPSHIIAAGFDKGNYLFGAVLQKGTLLFSVGDTPYVLYTTATCGISEPNMNDDDKTAPGRIKQSIHKYLANKGKGSGSGDKPCAVLAEVNPTGQTVNKIHWAVTLEDGVVSKKLKAKKTPLGKNISTFTGNLIDTPIKPLIFQENVFSAPRLVVLSPSGYLHCYDLNGNTLWAVPSQCGVDGSADADGGMITLEKIKEKSGDYISLSAQQVSGKSLVVTTCGGLMTLMWAENGETIGNINVGTRFQNSTSGPNDRQVISNIMFSQVAPAPSAPIVAIVKARIPETSNKTAEEQTASTTSEARAPFTMPMQSNNYYLDIYALSGFDGNASTSFFYTVCCVLVSGLLGMILVSSFPPPSAKSD